MIEKLYLASFIHGGTLFDTMTFTNLNLADKNRLIGGMSIVNEAKKKQSVDASYYRAVSP